MVPIASLAGERFCLLLSELVLVLVGSGALGSLAIYFNILMFYVSLLFLVAALFLYSGNRRQLCVVSKQQMTQDSSI
jgi:hypothetical protein